MEKLFGLLLVAFLVCAAGSEYAQRAASTSITKPTANQVTSDNTPDIEGIINPVASGTAMTITLTKTGSAAQTYSATTAADGKFTYTPSALTDGVYRVKAKVTSGGVDSSQITFTVDTTPPATPFVTFPSPAERFNTKRPRYTGTAEAYAKVYLNVNGVDIGSYTLSSGGTWNLLQPTDLPEKNNNVLKVKTVDAALLESSEVTVTFATDYTGPTTTMVYPGGGQHAYTISQRPKFEGTTTELVAGTIVRIYLNNPSTYEFDTTADAAGKWEYTHNNDMPEGQYNTRARSKDAYGNWGPYTAWERIYIDLTDPSPPAWLTPVAGRTKQDSVRYTGTGEPEAQINIYLSSNGGAYTKVHADGEVKVGGSGGWGWTQTAKLPEGTHSVYATATDRAGRISVNSATITWTTDYTGPTVTLTTPTADLYTNDQTPTFSGSAGEQDATVSILIDGVGHPIPGTTPAGGAFSWTPTTDLTEGKHYIRGVATDSVGNKGDYTASRTITVDITPPTTTLTAPAANMHKFNSKTPTITGKCSEEGCTVTVDIDAQEYSATVNGKSWSYTVLSALDAANTHTAKAKAVDLATNQGSFSTEFTFTVPPDQPVITQPTEGARTPVKPYFSGTAENNAYVVLSVDGTAYGDPVQANGSGNWVLEDGDDVSAGDRVVKARSYFFENQFSASTANRNFKVIALDFGPNQNECVCDYCAESKLTPTEQWCQDCAL